MIFNTVIAGKGGASLDIITAASLPGIVVENRIVVITDTTPGTIYVDTDEPANPVNGDVWVQVGSSDYGVEFSETFRNGLIDVLTYTQAAWFGAEGYVGSSGEWRQFGLSIPAVGTPLEDWTWNEIIRLANSWRDPAAYFSVGDKKNLVLSTEDIVEVVIGAFRHNQIHGTSTKAAIAFSFVDCLANAKMNSSNTNAGGWESSWMRNTHMPDILSSFPAELLADGAIKTIDVIASAGSQSTNLVTSTDRLRLHSITELGLTYSTAAMEGAVYDYYAAGNRVKKINGEADIYWTRSPAITGSDRFCCISATGTTTNQYAGNARGVACCFDI